MSTISINLPEDDMTKLQEAADRLGITPEELVRASIEELLNQPEESFKRAMDYVMKKNADLYKRLA